MNDQSNPDIDAFLGTRPQPAWRRYVKWGLIALGIVLLALALRSWFAGDSAPQYATAPVQRGDLRVTVSATGKLAPTNQVTVGSQISGLVVKVVADVNDRVTEGQPLALIDPEQLDAQIAQGQAQLNANRAAVAQAQATLQEARAQLGRFEEVSRLSGGRVPSKTELDTARAAVARGVAGVNTAQANVAAAQAQLSSAQTQRARAIIRSPVNGVVLARQVELGQTVAASFNTPTLFVIAEDLSQMKLEVAVDEADVGEVKEGQPANFTVDAFPGRTFPARITRVDVGSNLSAQAASSASSTSATTSTSAQVVSYAATLSVENPNMQLRPGMTATAEIVTSEKTNVLTVPNAALRYNPEAAARRGGSGSGITGALVPRGRRGGQGQADRQVTVARGAQQTVYVLGADGKPSPVRITTGDSDGSVTEVTGGGLRPGMTVITGQLATGEGDSPRRSGGGGGGQRGGGGAGAGGGGQRGQ